VSVIVLHSARLYKLRLLRVAPASAGLFVAVGKVGDEQREFRLTAGTILTMSKKPEEATYNFPASANGTLAVSADFAIQEPSFGEILQIREG
jgi:hypothetical protein